MVIQPAAENSPKGTESGEGQEESLSQRCTPSGRERAGKRTEGNHSLPRAGRNQGSRTVRENILQFPPRRRRLQRSAVPGLSVKAGMAATDEGDTI